MEKLTGRDQTVNGSSLKSLHLLLFSPTYFCLTTFCFGLLLLIFPFEFLTLKISEVLHGHKQVVQIQSRLKIVFTSSVFFSQYVVKHCVFVHVCVFLKFAYRTSFCGSMYVLKGQCHKKVFSFNQFLSSVSPCHIFIQGEFFREIRLIFPTLGGKPKSFANIWILKFNFIIYHIILFPQNLSEVFFIIILFPLPSLLAPPSVSPHNCFMQLLMFFFRIFFATVYVDVQH